MKYLSYGCLGVHKKQFNVNKLKDNKPVVNFVEFIQACNLSNKYKLTN